LGCGSGRNFPMFNNLELYAVDFSKKMIELAKKRALALDIKVKLFESNANKLDLMMNSLIMQHILQLFIASQMKRKGENHWKNCTEFEKRRRAFITVWAKTTKESKAKERAIYSLDSWGQEIYEILYIYDKNELESLLKEIGFSILNSKEDDNIVIEVEK